MRGIILFIAVIAYMIGGYFVVGKLGELFDENYKGFDYDEKCEQTMIQNRENIGYPLRKIQ